MIATLAIVGCLMGAGQFTAPSGACTPGAYVRLTQAQACASKDRPSLPAADRRAILRRYGLRRWTGADGELDHRVPFALGGKTNAANVWPERGPPTGNPKDKLEAYVHRRVCSSLPRPMTVRSAVHIFLTDWRVWYRRYGPTWR